MPIFRLTEQRVFPSPELAEPDGLLAVGGDLSVERLLLAYSHGIFPWYGEDEPILWWSPDPRCVLLTDQVYVSRRLERVLRRDEFQITCNRSFDRVINMCAQVRVEQGEETWLVDEMQAAYRELHRVGYAHSIEAWQAGALVGGLYGVGFGAFFFGESMFHLRTNASKVVLVKLCRCLAGLGVGVLDCQVPNAHLFSMGASNLSRADFLKLLQRDPESQQSWPRLVLPDEL
jgi:leucyl/phenylalanyl-tRNA--protein transferase